MLHAERQRSVRGWFLGAKAEESLTLPLQRSEILNAFLQRSASCNITRAIKAGRAYQVRRADLHTHFLALVHATDIAKSDRLEDLNELSSVFLMDPWKTGRRCVKGRLEMGQLRELEVGQLRKLGFGQN